MLSGIIPDNSIQGNLFLSENKNCERKLMDMIDNVNFSQRDDVLKFAAIRHYTGLENAAGITQRTIYNKMG